VHESGAESRQRPGGVRDRWAFLVVVFGTFGLQGLTLVTGVLAARLLGVEGRGQVALVFLIGLLISQLTFGGSLPSAIAKSLAERGLAARVGLRRVVRRRVGLLVLPCLAAGVLLLLLPNGSDGGEAYGLAVAAAIMTLQTITFRVLVGSLQGEMGHLPRMALIAMVPQGLFTVALVTATVADWQWRPIDVLAAFFAASLVGLVAGWFALARPTGRREDELDEPALWWEARKNYVSSIGPIDGVGLDGLLVGSVLGTIQLGLYTAALAIAHLCRVVGSAVSVIVLPRVAAHHADPVAERAVVRRWCALAGLLIGLVVLALEAIVEPAIKLAFGEEFAGAIETARWLIVADGFLGFRKVLIAVLQGRGRGDVASWIELALTPVMVAGIVIAAAFESLAGIGITMVVVGVLACAALGVAVARPGRPVRQPVRPPSTTST
jgi:O-antigen/teichoic acid export membrane protein